MWRREDIRTNRHGKCGAGGGEITTPYDFLACGLRESVSWPGDKLDVPLFPKGGTNASVGASEFLGLVVQPAPCCSPYDFG